MSQYLTIPLEDGVSLANARLHAQNLLTGLTTGTTYTCYRLLPGSAAFVYSGEAVTVDDPGTESGPGESVTLQLTSGNESYALNVHEGVGTLEINGLFYAYDTADIIGKPPFLLAGPTTTETVKDISAVEAVQYQTGAYLYDPAGGVPVVTLRTVRGSDVLGEGVDYAVTVFDRVAGFSVRQDVVNAWGQGVGTTEIIAPLTPQKTVLAFDGSHALVKSDGIQAGGAESLLIVANAVLQERSGTLFRDPGGTKLRAYFASEVGRIYASNLNGTKLLNYAGWYSQDLVAGDNVCMMVYMNASGFSQMACYRNGTQIGSWSRASSALGVKLDTTDVLTIGYTNFGSRKDYSIKGGYRDFRIWTDLEAAVDVSSQSVASCFIDETGAARHPTIGNTLLGKPRIWVPTDPAQANALINLGTGGDFTAKSGVFA